MRHALPVPDLDSQAERSQGGDTSQALQPISDIGELRIRGHLSDRVIEAVTAIRSGQHGIERGIERRPLAEVLEALLA